MAKKVGQLRWFNDGNRQNYPRTLTAKQLSAGTAFPSANPITQLGVQTLPGTKLFLNSGTTPIIVGATGIYEIDVEGMSKLNSIRIDATSLQVIENNDSAYIIIDYVQETE